MCLGAVAGLVATYGRRGGAAPMILVFLRNPLWSISLSSTMRRESSMFRPACRLIAFNVANRGLSTMNFRVAALPTGSVRCEIRIAFRFIVV